MTLSIASGANPALLSRNWLSQDTIDFGTLTADEQASLVDRIIDGDRKSRWNGTNSTDGSSVSIWGDFRQGGGLVARRLDVVILRNINWKNFLIEYSTTGAAGPWTDLPTGDYQSGVQDNAKTDLILVEASTITGVKALKASPTHTFGPTSDLKRCGEIIAAQLLVQFSYGFDKLPRQPIENVGVVKLGSGKTSKEYIMRSAYTDVKWSGVANLSHIPESELLTVLDIREQGYPFTFLPEPGERASEAYQVFLKKPPKYDYTALVKSGGYTINLDMEEVGGA